MQASSLEVLAEVSLFLDGALNCLLQVIQRKHGFVENLEGFFLEADRGVEVVFGIFK
jgi:hypothetical protein